MGFSKYGTPRLKADGYRTKRENVIPHIREIVHDYLKGPDGKPFTLEDFHVELLELMFTGGKYIVNWPTDHAKLCADDTEVPTTEGWKLHGDLQVGDYVFGPDGLPARVIGLNTPDVATMLVRFSDGSQVQVHPRHEWTVLCHSTGKRYTYETQHLASLRLTKPSRGYARPHYQVDRAQPMVLPEADLPIDPYTLGVWLGDGKSSEPVICGSAQDMEHIVSRIPYEKGWMAVHKDTGVVYQQFKGIRGEFRKLGLLNNKHIPLLYQRASERQRRELMAGLIDTDGHIGHLGKARFSGISERLVRDVADLARSLGYRATVHKVEGKHEPYFIGTQRIESRNAVWGCQWVPDDGRPQGTLPRKAGTRTSPRRRVGIVSIEEVAPKPGRCIQVDRPDGLYLVTRNLIPTHNSEVSSFIFPILSLIEDPDESHIICGANINDSKSRVQKVERELETNEALTRDFPWVAKPKEKSNIWSATQCNVAGRTVNNRNPSMLAVSTSAQDIRGRRGKLIMDDIEGVKHRSSATEREKLLRFVQMEAWRCFEDTHESTRPLLIAVGTPFDPDSIYFDLERLHGWIARRFSAYVSEYEEVVGEDGEVSMEYRPVYTWPRKAEKVEQARREMGKEQFNIQYRMDPTGGDSTKLSAQQIVEMMKNGTFEEDQVRTYVSLDPAGGSKHRQADYAGISVVRLTWKREDDLPMVDIAECYNFRQGLFEQVRLCAELAVKYGCPVIYEANSQQGYNYPDTFNHLAGLGHIKRVELIRHYTTDGNKFDEKSGITVIPTLLKSGRLRVSEGQLESDGVNALTKEIRDLGQSGSHDHLLASIWFAYKRTFDEVKSWAAPKLQNGYSGGYFTPYTRFGNSRQPRRPSFR